MCLRRTQTPAVEPGWHLRGSAVTRHLGSRDFPTLIELYLHGRLPLEKFVTERIGIGEVEEAFHTMHQGGVLRSVVVRDPHAGRLDLGPYMQHPSPVGHGTHRFDSIHDQIPKHSLQLDSIAQHARQLAGEFSLDRDSPILKRTLREPKDLPNKFVDVEWNPSLVTLPEDRTNTPDNVAGTTPVLHDTIQSCPRFVEIWRRMGEPA